MFYTTLEGIEYRIFLDIHFLQINHIKEWLKAHKREFGTMKHPQN